MLISFKKRDIFHIENGVCELKDDQHRLIVRVTIIKNMMFLLKINNNLLLCFSIIVHDESQHWHLRFVQLNFDVLKKLYNWNMVKGLSSINHPNQVCGDCILGKNLKAPFLSENLARATEPLELVYKDLCEMRHSSNRYFLTFIDDYNRKF